MASFVDEPQNACNSNVHIMTRKKFCEYTFLWTINNISMVSNILPTKEFKIHKGDCHYKFQFLLQKCENLLKLFVNYNIGSHEIHVHYRFTIARSGISLLYKKSCFEAISLSGYNSLYILLEHKNNDPSTEVLWNLFEPSDDLENDTLTLTFHLYIESGFENGMILPFIRKTPSENVNIVLEKMRKACYEFKNEKVTFQIGEETEVVQKSIVCAVSSVFCKMLEADMVEKNNKVIIIEDIQMPVLRYMINFLYSGDVQNYSFDQLCNLYYAADKYDINHLQGLCSYLLLGSLTVENSCQIAILSLRHCDKKMSECVNSFICFHFDDVLKTRGWRQLMGEETDLASSLMNMYLEKEIVVDN